jgi:hypothetical protein
VAYKEDNTINHEITGTERFRLWGAKVREMLEGIGLTRTADTGQINWATVEWPAAETDAGYEIYRFNDTLQATRPIYIKIFYGRGEGEKRYRIGLQVGSKSNGTGTIEGGLSTRANLEPKASSGFAALGRIHAVYSDSEFLLWLCVNPAQEGGAAVNTATFFMGVGRLRDADGTIRSSSSFADVHVNTSSLTNPIGSFQQRNGETWVTGISPPSTPAQAGLVNNVAAPAYAVPYSTTAGRFCGPVVSHLAFALASQGDTGKVEIYGKQRTYIKAFSKQMEIILLRE